MKSKHLTFFISLSCVVILTVALTFVLKIITPQIITSLWWLQILFLTIINIVIYLINIKVKSKKDINRTTHFHQITTIAKLFLYLAILAIYAITVPEDAKTFIISFLIYYFCFTFFETFVKIKINN